MMYRLLVIVMDSVHANAAKTKTSILPELEMLLICLEETNNSLLAERILRIIANTRILNAISLREALLSTRYCDTIAISLLTKRGFTFEVRLGALTNVLFFLQEELQSYPPQILQSRKLLNTALNAILPAGSYGNLTSNLRNKYISSLDSGRIRNMTQQLEELSRPMEKGWLNVSMLAEVVSRALSAGGWELTAGGVASGQGLRKDMDRLVESLLKGEGKVEVWLLLPLMPQLLARCSLEVAQHALMMVNVLLKSDESQCEALSAMPDRSWIKIFIQLACIGETCNLSLTHSAAPTTTPTIATTTAASDGSNSASKHDLDVSATCTELALDSVSLIVEHKTRYHVHNSWSTWNCLQNCIRTCTKEAAADLARSQGSSSASIGSLDGRPIRGGKTLAEGMEIRFLKRCLSLVLQRLAKSSEGWNHNLINCLANVFSLIESRDLCGGSSINSTNRSSNILFPDTLIDTNQEVPSVYRMQTVDESQILSFMMDLMANLRKAANKGALNGAEWRIMRPALRIVLSCLSGLSDPIADRVGLELVAFLRFMSEPWSPLSAEKYKTLFLSIISALRKVIEDSACPSVLRNRYTAVVLALLHFFMDMRHTVANSMGFALKII